MTQQRSHRYCVIMSGGIGSRFWPYSRESRPKQFIDFLGTGRSLLQMTYDRILPIIPRENIIIVTNRQYAGIVKEQLPEVADCQILYEPARRNTAPCIAWAAHHIHALDPESSMVVLPSDNFILRQSEFEKSMLNGLDFVEQNDSLLTVGVKPNRPESRYGYIQIDKEACPNIWSVKTFTEKPDHNLAKVFVKSGEFFWNSGIFMWRTTSIIKAMRDLSPELAAVFERGKDCYNTPEETEFIRRAFPSCPNTSIDYAVLERSRNIYVETADFGWTDMGTWGALFDTSPKNRDGNVAQRCSLLSFESTGNVIAINGDKLVVIDGLENYIVADSGDVLLICPKNKEQDIRQIVNDVKMRFGDKYL